MTGDGPEVNADADADTHTRPESDPDAASGPSDDPTVSTDGGESVSVQLPDDLGSWLDDQVADDPDRDRGDVLRDLAAAYREIDDGTAVTDLADRLETQRAEYVDLVEDVRERVVDLAREHDDLAAVDHDHPDLADADDLDALATDLADLETTVEDGFDNYETVLEELTDAVDELSRRLDTLAARVVQDDDRGTDTLERLRHGANQAGVRTATCDDCGGSVDLGLLTDPVCPHCQARFVDLDTDSGLLGSPTLQVGSPPALAGTEGGDPGD